MFAESAEVAVGAGKAEWGQERQLDVILPESRPICCSKRRRSRLNAAIVLARCGGSRACRRCVVREWYGEVEVEILASTPNGLESEAPKDQRARRDTPKEWAGEKSEGGRRNERQNAV